MNKIVKRIAVSVLCLFAASFVFAADKSLGITADDVANYVKNYSQIKKEIDNLGYNEKGNIREPTEEEIQKRDEILKNNGISGPKRFEKTERIFQYTQQVCAWDNDQITKEQAAQVRKACIDNGLNEKDLKVIEPKAKEVMAAYEKYTRSGNRESKLKDSLNLPSFNFKKKKK